MNKCLVHYFIPSMLAVGGAQKEETGLLKCELESFEHTAHCLVLRNTKKSCQ